MEPGFSTMFQRMHDTEVHQADVLRQDVEIGQGYLREGELVGIFAISGYHTVDVAQGGKAKLQERT